ncbi:MAG: His/Gly/Thr/Pro-type tRNA ligase C-terminal domain-containing protein [Patescibacteria group bacterium]|nr:His/Gly/Thr/Pro-type tRNA ligase C-terminal domain-containing protein [Patescibacteria group bacterium]
MLQSKLFTKTTKTIPRDEISVNSQLLIRAGFIDKTMAGVYSYLPLGLKVLNKIKNIIRDEMDAIGGQEILMPALTPKEIWQQTQRYDNFDALFKLKGIGDKDYVLGATHEEVVTPLVKNFVQSYKDLPVYVYQIQDKYRNEPRAKSGLLRGREFSMKDLYSFHLDEKNLDEYYEKVKQAYFKIFKRVGLGEMTYLTYASGGVFSKYSHEFQSLAKTGEDIIYLCNKCHNALNKELIKSEGKKCPECGNLELEEKTAIEVGNIFKLGTKFSQAFDLNYTDENGQLQPVLMGCYGMGPSRIMGAVVEIHHDTNGIIWPQEITPYQVHLLNLASQQKLTDKIYETLQKRHIEVLYDDREVSPGTKLKDADLIGLPWRLVVSDKTGDKVEIKQRTSQDIKLIKAQDIIKIINK